MPWKSLKHDLIFGTIWRLFYGILMHFGELHFSRPFLEWYLWRLWVPFDLSDSFAVINPVTLSPQMNRSGALGGTCYTRRVIKHGGSSINGPWLSVSIAMLKYQRIHCDINQLCFFCRISSIRLKFAIILDIHLAIWVHLLFLLPCRVSSLMGQIFQSIHWLDNDIYNIHWW